VSCYNHDGTAYVNSFNNPGVTADLPSNAIPDSAILQNPMDEGTGTTAADAIWSNDSTFNGDPAWTVNSDYEGGYGITLDPATTDYLSYASPEPVFSISGTWAYGLTIYKESAGAGELVVNQSLSNDNWGVHIAGGDIALGFYDGSSYVQTLSHTEPSTPYLARLCVGADNGSAQFYLDTAPSTGTTQPLIGASENGLFRIGSRIKSGGGAGRYLSGTVDNPLGYDVAPANIVRDDYDLQPWT